MLERRIHQNGVVYYASPKLEAIGVPHGFSTRLGGISPAPFDSLNLGNPNGCDIVDHYERIWENYRLLATATGCGERALLRVHQVHGGNDVGRSRQGLAMVHCDWGDALRKQGRFDQAIVHYQAALCLDPSMKRAARGLEICSGRVSIVPGPAGQRQRPAAVE